jgi:hypothetical protein
MKYIVRVNVGIDVTALLADIDCVITTVYKLRHNTWYYVYINDNASDMLFQLRYTDYVYSTITNKKIYTIGPA